MKLKSQPEQSSLHLSLSVPGSTISIGNFSFDPVGQLLGGKIEELLHPILAGPGEQQLDGNGRARRRFPLLVRPGIGIRLSLGGLGELAVANEHGLLKLSVPVVLLEWLTGLAMKPKYGPSPEHSGPGLAFYSTWYELKPGQRLVLPIASLGELVLEAH